MNNESERNSSKSHSSTGNIIAWIGVMMYLLMPLVFWLTDSPKTEDIFPFIAIVIVVMIMLLPVILVSLGRNIFWGWKMKNWHRQQLKWAKAHQYTYRNSRYPEYNQGKITLRDNWHDEFNRFSGKSTVFLQKSLPHGRITIIEHQLESIWENNYRDDSYYYYVVLLESHHLPQHHFKVHQVSAEQMMTESSYPSYHITRYDHIYKLYPSAEHNEIFIPVFLEWLEQLPTDEDVQGEPGRIIFYGDGTLDPRLLDHLHKDGHALYDLFVNSQKEPKYIMAGRHDW